MPHYETLKSPYLVEASFKSIEQCERLEAEATTASKERDETRLSGQKNQQAERDRVEKAIFKVMARIKDALKKQRVEPNELNGDKRKSELGRNADEKTIQELSQDKAA